MGYQQQIQVYQHPQIRFKYLDLRLCELSAGGQPKKFG